MCKKQKQYNKLIAEITWHLPYGCIKIAHEPSLTKIFNNKYCSTTLFPKRGVI